MSYRDAKEISDAMGLPAKSHLKCRRVIATAAAWSGFSKEMARRGYSKPLIASMWRTVLYISDRTLEFNKVVEVIRVKEFMEGTGLKERQMYSILRFLRKEGVIVWIFRPSHATSFYGLHLPNMLKIVRNEYEEKSQVNQAYVQRVLEVNELLLGLSRAVFNYAVEATIEDVAEFKVQLIAKKRMNVDLEKVIKKAEADARKKTVEKAEDRADGPIFVVTDEGKLRPVSKNAMSLWHSMAREHGYDKPGFTIPDSMNAKELGAMKNWLIEMFRSGKREPAIREHIEFIVKNWVRIRNRIIKKTSPKGYPFDKVIPYGPEWWFFYCNRREVSSVMSAALNHRVIGSGDSSKIIDLTRARKDIELLGRVVGSKDRRDKKERR